MASRSRSTYGPPRKFIPDPPEMKTTIAWCLEHKVYFRKCSAQQIKVGQVSFWPITGKIILDGGYVHPQTGLAVFQQIALRLAALRTGHARPAQVPGVQPPRPPAATLDTSTVTATDTAQATTAPPSSDNGDVPF